MGINQYDMQGNLVREWGSIKEAAEFYGICKSNIDKCLAEERPTCKGYVWEKKQKERVEEMENIKIRGTSGELVKMRLEDRYNGEGYYSVEIKKDGKSYVFYAVELNEIILKN